MGRDAPAPSSEKSWWAALRLAPPYSSPCFHRSEHSQFGSAAFHGGDGNSIVFSKGIFSPPAIQTGLGVGGHFFQVYGGNSFDLKKPDPIGVQALMRETGIPAGRTLMIGDSSVDIQTARNAGIASCGVTYGFQPETLADPAPDRLLDRMEELADWLVGPNGEI